MADLELVNQAALRECEGRALNPPDQEYRCPNGCRAVPGYCDCPDDLARGGGITQRKDPAMASHHESETRTPGRRS